ncbi:hypothetical protein EYC84_008486 [Monilinia fructicola]|uniref:Uncharacterized protein n=1 Tax=Monilinia fructicola TaxID=38448 RepID=A0A5M9JFC1_MONFR|nr:hypothetical protein EYC84_008486 [Monilinia fructicola]
MIPQRIRIIHKSLFFFEPNRPREFVEYQTTFTHIRCPPDGPTSEIPVVYAVCIGAVSAMQFPIFDIRFVFSSVVDVLQSFSTFHHTHLSPAESHDQI